ncbi:cation transporter [Gammaproteobacteria bacterium 42_54_T18]|nr:cation transporter [Gammaproteobacteria bacterium 42_54_T18]
MGAEHNHGNIKGKKLGISILLNILITVAQGIGALVSGSLSLLSDALHNFSDVIALIISYIAETLTQKEATPQQTFGYKRAEVIAALINAASLIAIALMLIKEAIIRFNEPAVIDSLTVIVLAALSILVNGGSAFLIKNEAKENMNMKSAYLHLLSDLISSVAVLVGGICMSYFQVFWIDSLLSIGIAIYLIISALGLLIKTLKVLMQFTPSHIQPDDIQEALLELPYISNLHHLHIWQLNDKDIHLEAHLDFSKDIKLSEVSKVIERANTVLQDKFNISHSLLQPEFGVQDSKTFIVDDS